jgi:hypothetical protein
MGPDQAADLVRPSRQATRPTPVAALVAGQRCHAVRPLLPAASETPTPLAIAPFESGADARPARGHACKKNADLLHPALPCPCTHVDPGLRYFQAALH